MKRIAFFLVAALAMGMTACKTNPSTPDDPTSGNNQGGTSGDGSGVAPSTEWTVRFVAGFSEDVLSLLEKPITMTYTLPGETEARTAELTGFQPYNYGDNISIALPVTNPGSIQFAHIDIAHVAAGTLEYQLQVRAISDMSSQIDTTRTYTCGEAFLYFTKGDQDKVFSGSSVINSTSIAGRKVETYMQLLLSEEHLTEKHSVTVPYK